MKKHRYFIQLAYNGKNYHGWQVQPNAITVQEKLENALMIILRQKIEVCGAGRTDTGVHASFFVAHFEVEKEILQSEKLAFKLNRFLPFDIRIDTIFEVKSDMHARFNALSRTYFYFLSYQKEPFKNDTIAFTSYKLDIDLMNEAALALFDYTDFTSFSKLHTDVKTNNCKIMKAGWEMTNEGLVFEIKADRFLRNMVRAIVGTLIEVGRKKMTIAEFRKVIEDKDRAVAGASALAHGLFLANIEYPPEVEAYLIKKGSKKTQTLFS